MPSNLQRRVAGNRTTRNEGSSNRSLYVYSTDYSFPSHGKGARLAYAGRREREKGQVQGQLISLATPVFGADLGSLVITVRFNDLAELEKRRTRNAADKEFQDYVGKVSAIADAKFELLEVIVPFPKS